MLTDNDIPTIEHNLLNYALIIVFVVVLVLIGSIISDDEIAERYYTNHVSQFVIPPDQFTIQ